jgi:hypothetical protein
MPEPGAIGNLIFISYRRVDTAAHALALRLELETDFRAAQIFLDTHTIQGSDEWPKQIQDALRLAKVVVVMIGKGWIGPTESGSRRLDDPNDWVHKEIAAALNLKQGAIIPILVDGAPPLRRIDLPDALKDLADIQPIKVDLNEWDKDIKFIVSVLRSKFGFELKEIKYKFPKPDPLIAKTVPLTWSALENEVAQALPDWRIEFSDDPEKLHYKRVELVRDFQFESFTQALEFLNAAGR